MTTKYSIDEIDQMREALRDIHTWSNVYPHKQQVAVGNPISDERLEIYLRTHMTNGTPAQDLIDRAHEVKDKLFKMMQESDN